LHPIELKGFEAEWVANLIRLMVIGNEDWLVPASMTERRWGALDVNENRIQDTKYFAAIVDELNNGGYEALLYLLLNYDLSGVDLRKVPSTDALLDQKFASLNTNERWWLDVLRRGELPSYDVTKRDCPFSKLYEAYLKRTEVD